MRNILLLTATIAPKPGTHMLNLVDSNERLQEYLTAFSFYLDELSRGSFDAIVFAENSGSSLASLEELAHKSGRLADVTFLSLNSSLGPKNHRFYLELDLLNGAVSRLPQIGLRREDRLWKVTGRYIIRNIRELVQTAPSNADAYFNSRTRPKCWTEFYIAAFNMTAFKGIFGRRLDEFAVAQNGEEVLWRRLNESPPAGLNIVQRFRRVPKLSGRRGWDGRRYDDLRGKTGRIIRVISNRVLPWLWI